MENERRPLVLLVGTDRYAMEACVRLGIDAVVVCGFPGWDDGLARIPEQLTVLKVDDQSNPEAILMALHRAGLADAAFDGVQTTDEWALVTVALIARHLGCRALCPATAVHFRDKSLQKRRVTEAGIAAAQVTVIEDVHDVSGISAVPYERAVLKPVAGAATARTSLIESLDDLRARSSQYRAEHTPQRTFALEQYIEGEEWIADGILYGGELLFCAVGAYGKPCLATLGEQLPLCLRHFDPQAEAWAYDRALPAVTGALTALGLRDGVFHMELFHDPATGSLTFSECAARRGGALIHEQLQAKFNVNLAESALMCALGRRPELQIRHRRETIGGTYLTGRPGVLVDCPAPTEVLALPGVEFVRIERPRGSRIPPGLASTNQRVGQFLVAADSEEQLVRRFAEVQSWFDERLVVIPDGARPRELRSWQQATWPDADLGDTLWQRCGRD